MFPLRVNKFKTRISYIMILPKEKIWDWQSFIKSFNGTKYAIYRKRLKMQRAVLQIEFWNFKVQNRSYWYGVWKAVGNLKIMARVINEVIENQQWNVFHNKRMILHNLSFLCTVNISILTFLVFMWVQLSALSCYYFNLCYCFTS